MKTVNLVMTNSAGETIYRELDITAAMHSGSECWELGEVESQRAALNRWIAERGNEQHKTILTLNHWYFV